MLTALSETTAKAIVIEADGCVVLGSSGPHASTARAQAATTNPLTTQRTICGRVDDPGAGLARRPLHHAGSGTSTMNPMTTVTTTKNLQNSSCSGNSATPPLMLRIVANTISCSTDDRIVSCSLT